jgi:hypothetical protein
MKRVTRDLVRDLIDFAPTEEAKSRGYAEYQLDGAVALTNMVATNRVAYLADEVGMGKTYVALAVMALLRWQQPTARIVVIAPRENIQRKWEKELRNFVRLNWKPIGNRVKSLTGEPAWEPMVCGSLDEFAHEALIDQDRDFFLRSTSFSLALKDVEARRKLRKRLRRLAPWLELEGLGAKTAEGFRDAYGIALNALVPDIDLLIVDEAHGLKHGFGPRVSTRNRVLGLALGHPSVDADEHPSYRRRVRRALLLSATPFEDDYGAIHRQLDVLGFGEVRLEGPAGEAPSSVRGLLEEGPDPGRHRELLARLMLRRVGGLKIAGRKFTKNMYRREWRAGGLDVHDEPMRLGDAKERLVVALIQKKVAEVLQHERFNNSFQIGMLSSFESFLETVGRLRRRAEGDADETVAETDDDAAELDGGTFDEAEQAEDRIERDGVDRDAVAAVVSSYRERFGHGLPHPKLDAAARSLGRCFESGEKSLVFVRRVATVAELGAKLDRIFDEWLRDRMETALPPEMLGALGAVWEHYERERRGDRPGDEGAETADETDHLAEGVFEEEDPGGTETFFSWFFRGEGPKGVLSGAAFQKNRLASQSSVYATFFEDDHVGWLLGATEDVVGSLAAAAGLQRDATVARLRGLAWRHLRQRSAVVEADTSGRRRYPRILVFEAYQNAGLELLEAAGGALGERAGVVLRERYPDKPGPEETPPEGFPAPEVALGAVTFFSELGRDPELRHELWPDEMSCGTFRDGFRRREQRRELISAMTRLGLAYVDLYLCAIAEVGSFAMEAQAATADALARLARRFVARLREQRGQPGPNAWRELSGAAASFDLLVGVNFPEVPDADLRELARIFGRTLQKQVPVGRMSGGVNKRLVRQFRMPGLPLVLVTTNVLQEGEDLHTFCRRVVHYGITWTPSAMEQRNGRVDRIGSLAQRLLDGRKDEPHSDELIQVQFPHLRDTVEVLQVRRVLRKVNRFLLLMHDSHGDGRELDSRIDAARALQEEVEDLPQITEELRSAFPVRDGWLQGELGPAASAAAGLDGLAGHLGELAEELDRRRAVRWARVASPFRREGTAQLALRELEPRLTWEEGASDVVEQRFEIRLRSRPASEATILRCEAEAATEDLDDETIDRLYDLHRELGAVRLSAIPIGRGGRAHRIAVGVDLLFSPDTTQIDELERAVVRTVRAAARLHAEFGGYAAGAPGSPGR